MITDDNPALSQHLDQGDDPKIKRFENFPDAFDYCREVNIPVIIFADDKKFKIFPSGAWFPVN